LEGSFFPEDVDFWVSLCPHPTVPSKAKELMGKNTAYEVSPDIRILFL
jgi:hypothetical protein